MKRVIVLLCAVLTCLVSSAKGDIKHVSATYEYISDNANETPEQAEMVALQMAKQQALEEAFGVDVLGITASLQSNRMEGQKVSSTSDFMALSETSVRGEWIETIKERVIEKSFEKGFWRVKVYVEGRARNHSTEKVAIEYALINNSHDRENRTQYYDGDDVYLRFTSPVAGAVCVYLVDTEGMAYCLLPYQSAQEGCQLVEANREYLFFSSAEDVNADEYTLNCQRSSEQNVIYIVYSPNVFTKAGDKQSGKNWRDEQMPRQLDYESFMKWLARNQTRDEDMVVRREIVTIRK